MNPFKRIMSRLVDDGPMPESFAPPESQEEGLRESFDPMDILPTGLGKKAVLGAVVPEVVSKSGAKGTFSTIKNVLRKAESKTSPELDSAKNKMDYLADTLGPYAPETKKAMSIYNTLLDKINKN